MSDIGACVLLKKSQWKGEKKYQNYPTICSLHGSAICRESLDLAVLIMNENITKQIDYGSIPSSQTTDLAIGECIVM